MGKEGKIEVWVGRGWNYEVRVLVGIWGVEGWEIEGVQLYYEKGDLYFGGSTIVFKLLPSLRVQLNLYLTRI